MSSNSISLKDPSIMALMVLIVGFVVIATLSAYVLWVDINTEYTWIIPLNENRRLWGYYKWSYDIGIYDLARSVNEPDNIVSLKGITSSIRLASSTTSYAIILARGINIYVSIVVLLTFIVYIVLQKKVMKIKTFLMKMLLSTLVVVFLSSMLILMIPYIDGGHTLGYNVTKDSISFTIPVKTLSLISLNSTGIPGFASYTDVYVLTDNVTDGSLVHAKFILRDNASIPPFMIVRVVQGENVIARYIGNDATFYVSLPNPKLSGQIRIYILTDRQLNNSLLEYTRLSFTPMSPEPPAHLIVAPVIGDLLLLALGYWVVKRLNQ